MEEEKEQRERMDATDNRKTTGKEPSAKVAASSEAQGGRTGPVETSRILFMPLSPWAAVIVAVLAIVARLWLPHFLQNDSPALIMAHDLNQLLHGEFSSASIARILLFIRYWFATFWSFVAFSWLLFRAYRVLSKPVEELIGLLGLEVPVAPVVSIAGIKADALTVHWKLLEKGHSVVKYTVKLNGIEIGEVGPHDSAAIITGLKPEHHYVLRITTLNSAGFHATSSALRSRTLSAASGQFNDHGPPKPDAEPSDEDRPSSPQPSVHAYKGFSETSLAPASPAPMVREHSNSQSRIKRGGSLRRDSRPSATQEAHESPEVLQDLQNQLERQRQEIEDEENAIREDEKQFETQRDSLQQEKDSTLKILKDRSKMTEDLRKEVSRADQKRAVAVAKRTQKEKVFRDAAKRRQDLKTDVEKWDKDIKKIHEFNASTVKAKEQYRTSSTQQVEVIRTKHEEELAKIEQLSEETRNKRLEIDHLEEEQKRLGLSDVADPSSTLRSPDEIESDRQWDERKHFLQHRYHDGYLNMAKLQEQRAAAESTLNWLLARRDSQPQLFNPTSPTDTGLSRRDSYHRRHRAGSRHESGGPSLGGFSAASGHNTQSPPVSSISPFFNMNNGGVPLNIQNYRQSVDLSASELDMIRDGGPLSPTVSGLLPRGLLTDETSKDDSLESPPFLPGLGAPQTLEQAAQGPASPASAGSRPPSIYASPRESTTQLAFNRSGNDYNDSDGRSIRSTTSSLRNLGSTGPGKFGSLFGLNRQRGKTLDQDGPSLGSLKGSQTQSLPRAEFHLDPIGTPQRRGSHSGGQADARGNAGSGWIDQMSSAFSRSKPADARDDPSKTTISKRRGFNMFGSKPDPYGSASFSGKPPSPRPASTRSGHFGALPRPSTESQERFGWPVEGLGPRNSPLGADWGMTHTNSWSRHPSRRPSVQYGNSTTSLHREGVYSGNTDDDDLVNLPPNDRSPAQAPIGTRPTTSQALNPAAPSFMTSLFSRERRADKAEKLADKKAEKAEKASRKAAAKERKEGDSKRAELLATPTEPSINIFSPQPDFFNSPPDSRKSKDTRSLSATESPRHSLDRTNSYTPSEPPNTSSIGKESFMSKLSRKSSSGKFNFPHFSSSKAKRQASEVGTPDEMDEDGSGMPGFTPRSMQEGFEGSKGSPALGSASGKSSSLSWSSIKRIGKKGDKTPSLHESTASEAGATTGDEDDHDDGPLALGLGLRVKAAE